MRKIHIVAVAAVCTAMLTGCKTEKKEEMKSEYLRPASMDYSKQDSVAITELVKIYSDYIKNKNIDAAADMLYELRHDSIMPLPEEKKAGYKKAYSQMPVYDCRVSSFLLRSDKNNEIKVAVQFIEDGNIETGRGITYISLNPVLKNGTWYLTLLDKNAEGVEDVYNR